MDRRHASLLVESQVCRTLNTKREKDFLMMYIIAVVLVALWLLGFITSHTMGGFIHVLLVIAVVVILVRVISGRKPL